MIPVSQAPQAETFIMESFKEILQKIHIDFH